MRFIPFFFCVLLYSCTVSKKSLVKEFNDQLIRDTAYVKALLPLYSRSTGINDETNKMVIMGYFDLVDYDRDVPIYRITQKGRQYMVRDYRDKDRDNEHLGIFNSYRVKAARLYSYKRINNSRDSVEAVIEAKYDVVPMFQLEDNPKYIKVLYTKKNGRWQIADPAQMNAAIYLQPGYIYLNMLETSIYKVWPESLLMKIKQKFPNER